MKTITIQDKAGTRTIPYSYETPQFPVASHQKVIEATELPVVYVETALKAQPGSHERTTPTERAVALFFRLIPLSGTWFILSMASAFMFSWRWPVAFLLFAVMTAITYIVMDRQEYQFSRNGVERFRINAAKELKMAELAHTAHLRKMALQSYLRMIERYE
jgi:hypothetical protein